MSKTETLDRITALLYQSSCMLDWVVYIEKNKPHIVLLFLFTVCAWHSIRVLSRKSYQLTYTFGMPVL